MVEEPPRPRVVSREESELGAGLSEPSSSVDESIFMRAFASMMRRHGAVGSGSVWCFRL